MRELQYAFRVLLKNPAFTAMAVLSLALGIGANAAIFSLLDAVLLKQLPVRHPEQLVFLEYGEPEVKRSSNISLQSFQRLRNQDQVITDLCFFSYTNRVNVSLNGSAEVAEGQLVSGDFFSTLGVQATTGRTITSDDDNGESAQPVAVISYSYWQKRFGSSPNAIGQSILVNNEPFSVIGVAPAKFFGVIVGSAPDIYLPAITGKRIMARRYSLNTRTLPFILARLKPGVSEQQAQPTLGLVVQQAAL